MLKNYNTEARYFPAIICALPFILMGFYFINQIDTGFWSTVWGLAFSGVTLSGALFYLMAFICRHVGKWLEDRYYKNGQRYPTTQLLIDTDSTFSPDRKQEIINKINNDFKINLVGQTTDSDNNRLRINEAVAPIRRKFFSNELVLQRNIQFGFARNLLGGALIAEAASAVAAIISAAADNQPAFQISILLCLIYALLILFGLIATPTNARRYAQALYDEFLLD